MPNRHMLSDRAKRLEEKAKHRIGAVELDIHPSALRDVENNTRRPSVGGERWIKIDLKVDDEYRENGGGDVDYYLAHELGHAVRIAKRAEPAEVREVYEHIENAQMNDSEKKTYIDSQTTAVRKLLYAEEVAAWDVARDLFEGIEHDSGRLESLREKTLRGYRRGLRID